MSFFGGYIVSPGGDIAGAPGGANSSVIYMISGKDSTPSFGILHDFLDDSDISSSPSSFVPTNSAEIPRISLPLTEPGAGGVVFWGGYRRRPGW